MSGALRATNYRFEGAEVQVGRQCILRDGEQHYLRAKTFQVLLYLLDHSDRLVTKQELFEQLWTDAVVSDASLVQCIIDLRKALNDDSRKPRYIRTVPKSGYQFIAPVTEVIPAEPAAIPRVSTEIEEYTRCEVEIEEVCETTQDDGKGRRFLPVRLAYILIATAILGLLAIGASIGKGPRTEVNLPQIAGKTRLAVLYFENQSGSERLDWLRGGLADIVITELSRSPSLTVLSRHELHSLLQRAGLADKKSLRLEDALLVAQKSHAEIVAIGSFAGLSNSVRINLQLHDGQTGRMLAAESIVAPGEDRILSDMTLLSLRAARDLGAAPGVQRSSVAPSSITRNLEAYRNYSLGVEKSEAYHNKEAVSLLERAIELDPQFAMAYARLGYNYGVAWVLPEKAKPFLEKAFALSDRLTERDRLNINAWYAVANLDYPAAVERYRELKAAYPYDTEAYVRLGMLLRGEERYDEAISVLTQGLAIDPDCKELYNTLGGIYSQLGRHEEAIAMQTRHVSLAPHEANAYDSLGLANLWAGRHADAEKSYLQSQQADPSFEIVLGHLGSLYTATGRYRDAMETFEKAGQAAPTRIQRGDAQFNLAHLNWRKGDRPQAIRMLSRATDLFPDRPAVRMLLALWRGDGPAATLLSKQLLQGQSYTHRGARPPSLRGDYYLLGKLALLDGKHDAALDHFRKALSHWTGLAAFDTQEDCLGNAYLQLGRWEEAIAEYQRVLRLFPGMALARFHLAVAFDRRGRPEAAREELKRFLQLWKQADPDIPEVLAANQYRGTGLSLPSTW